MKKVFLTTLLAILFNLNQAFCFTTDSKEQEGKGAKVRIIGSFYENEQKEKKLIIGAHFKIADGWKIYGNDKAGIGLPPTFNFEKSTNVASHEISWPEPKIEEESIGEETLKFPIYQNEVIIPVEVILKDENKKEDISLTLDYGLCKDICIPASQSFDIKIDDDIDEESLNEIQKFLSQKTIIDAKTKSELESRSIKHQGKLGYTIFMILIAIIGGAILNIMPCVLPVLSIKLMSVINHSEAPISRIRFAFSSTIIGILSCFIFFSGAAALIKITGNSLGWGLQFQDPHFLIFLIIILVFFIANLIGIFEITFEQFLSNFINKKINSAEAKKNIFVPNFLSGILAVLLATPCSAPFLGTAISFALSQNISFIFVIFLAIGLGFSLPYIILLLTPKLIYFLPKPGLWMIKIKKLMSLLLAATLLWLIYVLSNNVGTIAALSATILTILVIPALKIRSKFIKIISLVMLICLAMLSPLFFEKSVRVKTEESQIWKNFDENEIQKEINSGHIVVVDITADWCLTCKFNKIRVLKDPEVVEKLENGLIIAMRADITKPNPVILDYLHRNGRFAIPFNAVYGPNARDGLLTSELLTKKELFELIEKAK